MVKSGVDVFDENNARKRRGDDPRSIGSDGRIRADNPGTGTDADAAINNPGTAANNSGTAADDSSTRAYDPGTGTDADTGADNPGTGANDPGTGTNAEAGADNPGTASSNKARARVASLFALRHALFLLASSSETVTAFLPSFLPSSSSTTLRSKSVLSCSVTLVKQGAPSSRYPVDKMWRPNLSKVSSGISAVVRFS